MTPTTTTHTTAFANRRGRSASGGISRPFPSSASSRMMLSFVPSPTAPSPWRKNTRHSACSSALSVTLDPSSASTGIGIVGGASIEETLSQMQILSSQITVAAASTDPSPTPTVFEPTMPSTTTLVGMASVLVLSVVAGLVWANSVVPVSRTKLAISKSRGEVKEYLDGLQVDADVSDQETAAIETDQMGDESDIDQEINPNVGDGRGFERWLFSDWLNNNKSAGKPGRQKEPALPILKNAKWNSGDNPVLVTAAIMMVGVVLASVTERVATL